MKFITTITIEHNIPEECQAMYNSVIQAKSEEIFLHEMSDDFLKIIKWELGNTDNYKMQAKTILIK